MLRITLRGLWANRLRQVGTLVAILLAVGFLSGTLALGDTLKAAINTTYSTAYATTDVVVRNATDTSANTAKAQVRGLIDGSVIAAVRAVPGVADAEGVVQGSGVLVGANGVAVEHGALVDTWVTDTTLNPWRLVAGSAPRGTDEIVIDQNAATTSGLRVGQRVTIDLPDPVPVTVVGIADFGSQTTIGNATYAAFTLAGAQRYLAKGADRVSSVVVRAAPGVSQSTLAARIRAVLPPGDEAVTGSQLVAESESAIDSSLNSFLIFLDVFAGIALLVAALSIHNAFTIGAAQRARDHALLRAVGATRRQVGAGLAFEAGVLGVVGALVGLAGGYGIAAGLKSVFSRLGLSLPGERLVFTAGAAEFSAVVGVIVTLLAAASPAVRGSRTAPIEALRDIAVDAPTGSARRTRIGLGLTGIGVLLTLVAAAGQSLMAGIGAIALLVGALALGPRVVGVAIRVLDRWFHGTTRRLAQRNAARDPRRTAGAATALIVGVTVVTLFTVFAASTSASVRNSVGQTVNSDVVVSPSSGGGFSPRLAVDAAAVPGVSAAVGIGRDTVDVAGASTWVNTVDPTALPRVVEVTAGTLGADSLAVSTTAAASKHLHVGDTTHVTFSDGTTLAVPVGAIYTPSLLFEDYVLPATLDAAHTTQSLDQYVFVRFAPGVNQATVTSAVTSVADRYAGTTVQSKADFVASTTQKVSTLLNIVYVMLALAILIALLGIANTLALAVHERVREIGLLRAVGATGGQVRAMIRWESLVTTLIGALTGLALGTYAGWALVTTSNSASLATFAAPPTQLVTITVISAAAGLLAGVRPARRASRLNVIRAIGVD
jgi:putative ABC transport system permease protein